MSNGIDTSQGLMGPVVRGGKWLFLAETAVRATHTVRTLVLMVLFSAKDWGLWAAIFTTLHLLRNLSDTGISMVAIQHREGDSAEVLSTTWWLEVLRGVVLGGLLVVLAPVVGLCFPDSGPRLVGLLRVVSLVFLLEGFVSVGIITAQRRLAFNRLVLIQQGSTMLSILLAVVLGVVFRNVLALVIAELLRATLLLALSYVVLPVRPSLAAGFATLVLLLRRGWHLYVARLSEFLTLRGAVFVVGRILGTTQLGCYHLALNFGLLPSIFITAVVSRVIFPAFAKMQDDSTRLKEALLRVQRFVVQVCVPASLGIVALAPVLAAIKGIEYAPMVRPTQVFALAVVAAGVSSINVSALLGLGRFDLVRKLRLLQLLLVAVAIYPLTRYFGLPGAAMVAWLELVIWVLVARLNGRRIGCGVGVQLRNMLFIIAPAAAMGLTVALLWCLLPDRIILYAVGVIVLSPTAYFLALWLGAPVHARESWDVLKQAVGGSSAEGLS